MKILKRGLAVAVVTVVSVAVMTGSASATLSPDPYSTSSGSGSFVIQTILGPGGCDASNVAATLTGTAGGATGTISAVTVSNCVGIFVGASFGLVERAPIIVRIDNGVVTFSDFRLLINNIYGGACLYSATLNGSLSGGDTVAVAGTISLETSLNGFCEDPYDLAMELTLPYATIS